MFNLLNTDIKLYHTYLNQAPIGVVIIEEKGKLVWLNGLAQSFLANLNMGDLIVSSQEWSQFKYFLSEKKPFFFRLHEQGFVFTPQPLGTKLMLWMVPSSSMEVDLITMQQDLIQQRKLANLGKMMLEMAHELNNPLTGISMGIQLITRAIQTLKQISSSSDVNSKMHELLEKIQAELKRVSDSVSKAALLRHELLSFSKPDDLTFQPCKVQELIHTTLEEFKSQPIFKHMAIQCEFSEYPGTILCDPIKLEQILYNLLKNTYDATEGKGKVWIREFLMGNHVRLEFEDNGPGIPEAVLAKIFSPFLTTKPHTGNGLGLSISQQIIHQHGGTITVYNKPQSGACFQMTFPAMADQREADPQ